MKAQAIIERELIVSAKSWKTYLFRLIPPSLTMLILGAMVLASDFGKTVENGQFLFFVTLAVSAFYAGISTFLVSSTLSHEREAGTLGLLFLTPLKSRDVILGKLISASHLHLQSILTLLPLEAMAFVLGGISLSGFLGMNLFILCWLFYSTSAGICISSLCPNERVSGVVSLIFIGFVTLGICAIIALLGFWLKEWGFFSSYEGLKTWHETLLPFTPVGMFGMLMYSLDIFQKDPDSGIILWRCIVGMFCLVLQGGFFLWLASTVISRVWRKQPSPQKIALSHFILLFFNRINLGDKYRRVHLRLRLLCHHPYDWICGRSRIPTLTLWLLWLAAILPLAYLFHLSLKPIHTPLKILVQFFPSLSLLLPSLVSAPLCFIACLILKFWTAYVVCMRIQRDTSTGMLPLILSTSVSPRAIILSQIRTLFKRIWLPLLATFGIVVNYVVNYSSQVQLTALPDGITLPLPDRFTITYIPLAYGVILLVADLLTLSIVGIGTALRSKKIQTTFISTLSIVLSVPWVVAYISIVPWMKAEKLTTLSSSPGMLVGFSLAALLYDAALCFFFYRLAIKRMRN